MQVTDAQIAAMMLAAGFPPDPQVIAEGIGVVHAESGGNSQNGAGNPNGHIGLWSLSPAFGSEKERLGPLSSTVLAYNGGNSGGGYKQTKWQAWAPYETEETEGTGPSRAHLYLPVAKKMVKQFSKAPRKKTEGGKENVIWQPPILKSIEPWEWLKSNPSETPPAQEAERLTHPLKTAEEGINGIGETAQFLSELSKLLFTPEGWLQIGQVAGGIILIGWGLHHIINVSTGVNPTHAVTKTATKAAEVAAIVK